MWGKRTPDQPWKFEFRFRRRVLSCYATWGVASFWNFQILNTSALYYYYPLAFCNFSVNYNTLPIRLSLASIDLTDYAFDYILRNALSLRIRSSSP
jgi:hypothetical protein